MLMWSDPVKCFSSNKRMIYRPLIVATGVLEVPPKWHSSHISQRKMDGATTQADLATIEVHPNFQPFMGCEVIILHQ